MRRDSVTLADIAARDNLLLAVWKAARGKRHGPAVAHFLRNLDESRDTLASDVLEERAPDGRFRRFTIRDPKQRTITAVCFADRVLHHAILNRAEPRFERMLVDSSFACRPGKGVHAAARAVQRNLRRWPWFVKVDVDGYFPSIDHGVLEALLATRFKGDQFLALLGRIIDSGAPETPGRGLPIGALTSQHFANAYLDAADRMLLGHDGVRAHVRYMDDIVWWCPTREAAMTSLEEFGAYLRRERRLRIKPGAHVGRSERGLAYCGFRIRPGIVLASPRKLARYRHGLARIDNAIATGQADPIEAQRAFDGVLATLAGAETSGFRRRLEVERDDRTYGHGYHAEQGCRS